MIMKQQQALGRVGWVASAMASEMCDRAVGQAREHAGFGWDTGRAAHGFFNRSRFGEDQRVWQQGAYRLDLGGDVRQLPPGRPGVVGMATIKERATAVGRRWRE